MDIVARQVPRKMILGGPPNTVVTFRPSKHLFQLWTREQPLRAVASFLQELEIGVATREHEPTVLEAKEVLLLVVDEIRETLLSEQHLEFVEALGGSSTPLWGVGVPSILAWDHDPNLRRSDVFSSPGLATPTATLAALLFDQSFQFLDGRHSGPPVGHPASVRAEGNQICDFAPELKLERFFSTIRAIRRTTKMSLLMRCLLM